MSDKALQTINTDAVVGSFTPSELDTLKATIARGTSNEQFALFVQTCARSGLNPFLNQIFCTVYNGKDGPQMSIQIAVEGIVMLAKKNPHYKGFIAAEVRANDEFSADYTSGEVSHKVEGLANRGATVGAYCVAYRENCPNILVIITADQVEHLKKSDKGAQARMWKDYFDDMITKYAIKRAFKRQFGIEVAEDEYIQSGPDAVPAYTPPAGERRDITEEADAAMNEQPPAAPPVDDEETKRKQINAKINAKLLELGITPESRGEFIANHAKFKNPEKPTVAERTAFLKLLELRIEEKKAKDAAADDDLLVVE